jgi:hypothetical protein
MAAARNWSRPKLVRLALGFLLLAACGTAIGVYGSTRLRWGCPSAEEANRSRHVGEVMQAFGTHGIPLSKLRDDVASSTLYFSSSREAALFVRVCEPRCSGQQLLPPRKSRIRHATVRQGVRFGNVSAWIAAPSTSSANALRRRVGPAVDDLTTGSDTRCFPS